MPISIPSSIKGISAQGISKGPLEVLYGIKNDKQILSYPRDLNTNPAKQHVIQFTIMRLEESSKRSGQQLERGLKQVQNITTNLATNLGADVKAIVADPGGALKTVKNKLQNMSLQSLAEAGKGALGATDQAIQTTGKEINEFVNTQFKPEKRLQKQTINLYIPDGLNVQYGAEYSETSMTDALGTPYFYAQVGASVYDAFKKSEGTFDPNAISGNPYLRQVAADLALGKDAASLAVNATGYALNPQLQVLFKGIKFRQFRFEFTFTPYSQQEAEDVKKIVSLFKYASAPEIVGNKFFTEGLFYKVPDQLKLNFLFQGRENTNIPKIDDCVIRSVDVQYTPMGWATFSDGNPVQTKMTIELEETTLIDKNKITQGY